MMDKSKKIKRVVKPYLTGDIFDRATIGSALKFFVGILVMAVAFMIVCAMIVWEQPWLNITANLIIVSAIYLMFAQNGLNTGCDAVNQGEILYARQEKGRPIAAWEKSLCYHPLKGFLSAFIGSLPLLVCSVILAFIAQRQMSGLGVLPSWVGTLEGREEIGGALAIYHETSGLDLEAVMRLIVRMAVMPYVNMVGAADFDGMLVLERVSPLLCVLPMIFYGLGYMGGVYARSQVHTNVALGKKNLKRKQAKERRARQHQGPQQLN